MKHRIGTWVWSLSLQKPVYILDEINIRWHTLEVLSKPVIVVPNIVLESDGVGLELDSSLAYHTVGEWGDLYPIFIKPHGDLARQNEKIN